MKIRLAQSTIGQMVTMVAALFDRVHLLDETRFPVR